MRIFRDFLSENQAVNNIIETASQNPAVQGVILEMNSIWLNLWRLYLQYGQRWLTNHLRLLEEFEKYFPFPYPAFFHWETYVYHMSRLYLESDYWFSNEPLGWSDFLSFRKIIPYPPPSKYVPSPPPFTVRICLRPSFERVNLNFDYNSEDNFIIAYEVRPISFLWNKAQKLHRPVVGGTSIGIGPEDFGTLGGILMDGKSSRYYGITCSHVVQDKSDVFHPAKCDSKKSIRLGQVTHRSALIPLPNEYYKNKNLSSANEVDVALIELTEPAGKKILDIGKVYDIFPEDLIVPRIGVSFMGRSSQHKEGLYLDGEVVFYDLEDGTNKYRFKNLVQVKLGGKLSNLVSAPTKDGDSGAWVCTAGPNGPSWCGMIIGGFEQTGYAVSAEKVMNWIRTEAKLDLTLMQ